MTSPAVRWGRATAAVTFVGGTIIFLAYLATDAFDLLFVGYAWVAVAVPVHLALLGWLAAGASDRRQRWVTGALLLANLPVFLVYSAVTVERLNTLRLTLTNGTSQVIEDLHIEGCGGGHLDRLDVGASATVPVAIPADCAVQIGYVQEGVRKRELVAGYLTPGLGGGFVHVIGGR